MLDSTFLLAKDLSHSKWQRVFLFSRKVAVMEGGLGAFLKRWGFILVLVIVAVIVRMRFSGSGDISYDRILACTACNHVWGASLDTSEVFPVKCPECEKPAGGFAYSCEKCQTVFAFIPAPSAMPVCPKCGSTDCSRLEQLPGQEPE
jgi:hypothetical protein